MLRTGDLGIAQVRDAAFNPRLQMFPSQAIDDPHHFRAFGRNTLDQDGFKEGILRAGNGGRALKFRVLKNHEDEKWGEPQEFTDFDASEFMHIGRFNTIGQNRPLPWMLHGQDAAVNILDLRALNMASAKINAYFAGWIESKDGTVPSSIAETMLERMEKQGVTSEGETPSEDGSDEKDTLRSYANFMGSAAFPVFEEGEKMNFFKGDFSSMNIMELINWLINDIAIGYGVDAGFIWAVTSQTGPMARLTLQKADWFFDDLVQIMVSRMCQPTWDGVIEDAIWRGLIPAPKNGADFRDCAWQGPGSMTIDKGRDGKLFKDLVNSGMETRSLWHEMNGRNGNESRKRVIAEIIEDIKECHEQAEGNGIGDLKDVIVRLYFGNDKAMGSVMASPNVAAAGSDPEAIANAIVDEMEFRNEAAA
jgi:capsid protein